MKIKCKEHYDRWWNTQKASETKPCSGALKNTLLGHRALFFRIR